MDMAVCRLDLGLLLVSSRNVLESQVSENRGWRPASELSFVVQSDA
jgi:hypothetical protein